MRNLGLVLLLVGCGGNIESKFEEETKDESTNEKFTPGEATPYVAKAPFAEKATPDAMPSFHGSDVSRITNIVDAGVQAPDATWTSDARVTIKPAQDARSEPVVVDPCVVVHPSYTCDLLANTNPNASFRDKQSERSQVIKNCGELVIPDKVCEYTEECSTFIGCKSCGKKGLNWYRRTIDGVVVDDAVGCRCERFHIVSYSMYRDFVAISSGYAATESEEYDIGVRYDRVVTAVCVGSTGVCLDPANYKASVSKFEFENGVNFGIEIELSVDITLNGHNIRIEGYIAGSTTTASLKSNYLLNFSYNAGYPSPLF